MEPIQIFTLGFEEQEDKERKEREMKVMF